MAQADERSMFPETAGNSKPPKCTVIPPLAASALPGVDDVSLRTPAPPSVLPEDDSVGKQNDGISKAPTCTTSNLMPSTGVLLTEMCRPRWELTMSKVGLPPYTKKIISVLHKGYDVPLRTLSWTLTPPSVLPRDDEMDEDKDDNPMVPASTTSNLMPSTVELEREVRRPCRELMMSKVESSTFTKKTGSVIRRGNDVLLRTQSLRTLNQPNILPKDDEMDEEKDDSSMAPASSTFNPIPSTMRVETEICRPGRGLTMLKVESPKFMKTVGVLGSSADVPQRTLSPGTLFPPSVLPEDDEVREEKDDNMMLPHFTSNDRPPPTVKLAMGKMRPRRELPISKGELGMLTSKTGSVPPRDGLPLRTLYPPSILPIDDEVDEEDYDKSMAPASTTCTVMPLTVELATEMRGTRHKLPMPKVESTIHMSDTDGTSYSLLSHSSVKVHSQFREPEDEKVRCAT